MILRIRQSLIGSLQEALKADGNDRMDEFLKALNGKDWGGNEYTQAGNRFEAAVTDILAGNGVDTKAHYAKVALEMASILKGATLQVHITKRIEVDGITFLLDGTLDALRAGQIFDIKYSEAYPKRWPVRLNYYLPSPQTPMYFKLVPEAKRFTYLITDGKDIYREWYYPDEVEPIESKIRGFMAWLEKSGNINTYIEHWRVA